MKALFAILILACSNSYALGPIANGEYTGETSCMGPDGTFTAATVIKLEDNTMLTVSKSAQGTQTVLKTFTVDAKGFFTFTADIGGTGSGYFTSKGFHYDAFFNGASGEDTFFTDGDSLYMISSASAYGIKYKCEGVFDSGAKKFRAGSLDLGRIR